MEIQRLGPDEVERFRAIRLRALDDAPSAFGTTFQQASQWAPEVWARLFGSLTAFVAVVDGRDVGMIRCAPDEKDEGAGRLGSLWVWPEARGASVGESLVQAVVTWARSRGFTRILLDVSDDNAPAIALYHRLGFNPTGVVDTLPPPRQHLGKHQRVLELG